MGFVDGKVAIVTGAASGIGRAAAGVFAREGARVLIADTDATGLAETAHSLAQAGAEVLTQPSDVSDDAAVAAMVAVAVDQWGRSEFLQDRSSELAVAINLVRCQYALGCYSNGVVR